MFSTKLIIERFTRGLRWPILAKVVIPLMVLVFGATINVAPSSFQNEIGGAVSVANKLTAIDKGFSVAAAPATQLGYGSCAKNITFLASTGIATTNVTTNDYVYQVQINANASTPTMTCFQVVLKLTQTAGLPQTYGPLYIATSSNVTGLQPINVNFDIRNTSLPASPFAFAVAICTNACP